VSYRKLDMEAVRQNVKDDIERYHAMVPLLQVMIFTMTGGGHLGSFAAEQPADFYIDDRVGHLPYASRKIYQAVEVLKIIAEETGLDPHRMPQLPWVHHCGAF
jgi:hypothetical protein